MPSDDARGNINIMDTLERLRSEKYPHIPRDLVRDVLRLHADTSTPAAQQANEIEALVRLHAQEKK